MSAIIPIGEGQTALAITRSLGKKGIDTTVVSTDRRAISFHSKYCSRRKVSDYNLDYFLKLSEKDIVMPVDEDIMLLLAKNKAKCGCKLPFSDYDTLEKVISKSSLVRHAIENNIPCPETYFINKASDLDRIGKTLKYPVMLKPDRGTGGYGIAIVDSPKKLKSTFKHVSTNYRSLIIQEKIPFTEKYKVQVLLNEHSEVRRVCVLKVKRAYPIDTGPSTFVETVKRDDVLKWGMKFLEPLDYYGIADFDFVIDERDKRPKLLEINPRFWGSLQGAITSGIDFPYLLYKMAYDGDIDVSLNYKTGIKCRNVIFQDLRYLRVILKGKYSFKYKLSALIDFFRFYQDDSYYIFSMDDIKPFLALLINRLQELGEKKINFKSGI